MEAAKTRKWMVASVVLVGVTALAVLSYQPELRKAMAQNEQMLEVCLTRGEQHLAGAKERYEQAPESWQNIYSLASSMYQVRTRKIRMATHGERVAAPVGTMPEDDQLVFLLQRAMLNAPGETQRFFARNLMNALGAGSAALPAP